jgi:hypothetical protein
VEDIPFQLHIDPLVDPVRDALTNKIIASRKILYFQTPSKEDSLHEIYISGFMHMFPTPFPPERVQQEFFEGVRACICALRAPKNGDGTPVRGFRIFPHLIALLKSQGVSSLHVWLPSRDSTFVLNKLVQEGILANPSQTASAQADPFQKSPNLYDIL